MLFAYFYGLCVLISFSLLTTAVRGGGDGLGYQISIAFCLFSLLSLAMSTMVVLGLIILHGGRHDAFVVVLKMLLLLLSFLGVGN